MTMYFLIKLAFSLLIGGLLSWTMVSKLGIETAEGRIGQRYAPYMSAVMLPSVLLFLFLIDPFIHGVKATVQTALSVAFSMFLHMSVYYLILALLMPILRRYISSRACAVLWLVPNFLYITQYNAMEQPAPKFVIPIFHKALWAIFALWGAGFFAVVIWKIVEHLVFRKKILKNAVEVSDERILGIWNRELDDAYEKKPKYRIVVSPEISTPLSVGFFRRSTRVVLPKREYSDSELSLIFRHEIVHLSRDDSLNKFFLVLCKALCWFNPLVWMAMKKSAEDIELSCDETVLLKADGSARFEYAGLLLKNAGSTKGFTTCLSASANSLRYRLKAVTEPRRKRTGAVIVGLTIFALIMSYGYVALGYGGTTGADVIYKSGSAEDYSLKYVRIADEKYDTEYYCTDEAALHDYLSQLEMVLVSGNYSFPGDGPEYYLSISTPDGTVVARASDSYILLDPRYNKPGENEGLYYLPDGLDWELFERLITAEPIFE